MKTPCRVEPLHCPNAAAYRLNSLITRAALAAVALAPALVPGCCIAARWAA
ncbi:MAG: hypothetical protein QG612_1359 [Pseudomonadota bacterium]|nr:hypothetical protein [Pseudomonadota bacterium]